MAATFDAGELNLRLQDLVGTESPSEVFRALLRASALAASRTAVFLVREGKLLGWGSVGYDPEVARTQKRHVEPVDVSKLADPAVPFEATIDFGQPAAAESITYVLRIRRSPIALVVADRASDEPWWSPDVLSLLVRMAESRLELDLVLRKLGSGSLAAAVASGASSTDSGATELAPIEEVEPKPDPALEPARRYARLLATDIRLYNEEAVALGKKNGDLLQRLGNELGRGKVTFCKRHGDLGPTGIELLHEAYVQVLADGDPALIPPVALE